MNKLFSRLSLLFLVVGLIFVSCRKDEIDTKDYTKGLTTFQPTTGNLNQLKTSSISSAVESVLQSDYGDFYYVDEIQVDFSKFDYKNVSQYTGYTVNKDGSWNVWEFTTKSKYIKWGKKNLFPVEKELRIRDALTDYIFANNIVQRFEETGVIPGDYRRFEQRLFDKSGQNDSKRGFPIVLGKNCPFNPGGHWAFLNTLPFMPPGWNNKTSSWDRIGVYGGLRMYDRRWYRRYMGTVWSWGLNAQCLPWWADNRISSCVNIG